MGIISWVKDKYYQNKYNNAVAFFEASHYDKAINILKEILDAHPSAPVALLHTLHKKLSSKDYKQTIDEIASLYKKYNGLYSECYNLAEIQIQQGNYKLCADYSAKMYNAGVHQLKGVFIVSAEKLIINDKGISRLNDFTTDPTLLEDLSKQLQ